MAAAATSPFVSWDDFARLRNSQDDLIKSEFAQTNRRVDQLDQKFDQLDQNVKSGFVHTNQRIDGVVEELMEVRAESMRASARFSNYTLKNPTLRIAPLVTFVPGKGVVHPDLALFPRHAKEFYALRHPTTERSRRILDYLVAFYDIQLGDGGQGSGSESGDYDDDDAAEATANDSERAVELLEAILGINEDNFVRFKERASELARRTPPPAIKRSPPPLDEPRAEQRRQRLEPRPQRPSDGANSSSEGLHTETRLEWRVRTRSTPPSQRATINNLGRMAALEGREQAVPAAPDSGSPTNPFTSPRET
jgi:hypothetical protein